MKNKIIAYLIVFAFIISLFVGLTVLDRIRWNDGYCRRCGNGQMEFLEIENYYYYYQCNECDWIENFSCQRG